MGHPVPIEIVIIKKCLKLLSITVVTFSVCVRVRVYVRLCAYMRVCACVCECVN